MRCMAMMNAVDPVVDLAQDAADAGDRAAYLAALTDAQLRFRVSAATSHGWYWDAREFSAELAKR